MEIRDKRYNAVIHMVTAATGAEAFYTLDNNTARSESMAKARELDYKVLSAWVGHPHIFVVDNTTDFKRKINRVEDIICQFVGAPRPITAERKYLVSGAVDLLNPELQDKLGIKVEIFSMDQTYLLSGKTAGGYNYLRRRGQNGAFTYTHSMVGGTAQGAKGGEQAIIERTISGREYVALLKSADASRLTVRKKLQCFLWQGAYYELQTFVQPDIGLSLLKTELDTGSERVDHEHSFPWFLKVSGEITGVREFSSYFLSEHYAQRATGAAAMSWTSDPVLVAAYERGQRRPLE